MFVFYWFYIKSLFIKSIFTPHRSALRLGCNLC